ncbi:MAG: type II secretion system minor pseudopilin GspJ [Gammaproteobacteria bacterium]|nr:type II secretion system minor pseudopilin GspJ [Gammaproteobacteria bacterium]
MNASARRGFTLIEVLVALAVFGVLSLLAYMSLSQTLANSDMLGERMTRLQSIQKTVSYLGSELLQVAPRPVRVELGGVPLPALQSSLASEFALQLTRGGWPNFAGAPRSTMQRVAYRIEDGDLLRYHWYVLDRTISSQPVGTVMLEDVSSLTFRFLRSNDDWVDQWPPLSAQAAIPPQSTSASGELPRAIEIVLVLENEGEITRIVEVLK